jgi:hypothetical protein
MNLPNILVLTGVFIFFASQATIYAMFLIPGFPIAMAAVGLSIQNPEKATNLLIDEHNRRAIEAFNRFNFEQVVAQHKVLTYDPTNYKLIFVATTLTILTFYGFMVNGGYIEPIGVLIKKALFGGKAASNNDIVVEEFIGNAMGLAAKKTIAQKSFEAVANNNTASTAANYVGDKASIFAKALVENPVSTATKTIGAISILGFTVKNADKIIALTDVATRAMSIYANNSGYAKHIIRVAGLIMSFIYPVGSIISSVFAADGSNSHEEVERVLQMLERNIDLIGLDYDEVVRRLAEEKAKAMIILFSPWKELHPPKDPEVEMRERAERERAERMARIKVILQICSIVGIIIFILGCIAEYEIQQLIINLENIERARDLIRESPPLVETKVETVKVDGDPIYRIITKAIKYFYDR